MKSSSRNIVRTLAAPSNLGKLMGSGRWCQNIRAAEYVTLFAGAMSWQEQSGTTHRILTSPDPEKRVRVLRERSRIELG